jgi:hypothetical protein
MVPINKPDPVVPTLVVVYLLEPSPLELRGSHTKER